jgi:hypothetical protein
LRIRQGNLADFLFPVFSPTEEIQDAKDGFRETCGDNPIDNADYSKDQ